VNHFFRLPSRGGRRTNTRPLSDTPSAPFNDASRSRRAPNRRAQRRSAPVLSIQEPASESQPAAKAVPQIWRMSKQSRVTPRELRWVLATVAETRPVQFWTQLISGACRCNFAPFGINGLRQGIRIIAIPSASDRRKGGSVSLPPSDARRGPRYGRIDHGETALSGPAASVLPGGGQGERITVMIIGPSSLGDTGSRWYRHPPHRGDSRRPLFGIGCELNARPSGINPCPTESMFCAACGESAPCGLVTIIGQFAGCAPRAAPGVCVQSTERGRWGHPKLNGRAIWETRPPNCPWAKPQPTQGA
jgi:hypothetical protein